MFVAQMSWARTTTERGNLPHAWSGNGRHHIQDFQRNFMNIGKRHKNIMDGLHLEGENRGDSPQRLKCIPEWAGTHDAGPLIQDTPLLKNPFGLKKGNHKTFNCSGSLHWWCFFSEVLPWDCAHSRTKLVYLEAVCTDIVKYNEYSKQRKIWADKHVKIELCTAQHERLQNSCFKARQTISDQMHRHVLFKRELGLIYFDIFLLFDGDCLDTKGISHELAMIGFEKAFTAIRAGPLFSSVVTRRVMSICGCEIRRW